MLHPQVNLINRINRFAQLVSVFVAAFSIAGCAPLPPIEIVDVDGDGIVDAQDKCPDTTPRHPVTDQGCDIFMGTLEQVSFSADGAALNSASRQALDELIRQLQDYKQVVLAIDAHTDNRGSARDNLELSKRRVMSVVRYLVVKGVNARRLRPYGYGESRPKVSNATREGREINRRIEIYVHSVSGA